MGRLYRRVHMEYDIEIKMIVNHVTVVVACGKSIIYIYIYLCKMEK